MKLWQLYLLITNAAAFAAFGIDKYLAKTGAFRIPEKILFAVAAIGGSPGAIIGMKLFKHKTLHRTFTVGLPAIFILQVVLVTLVIFWYYKRRG